MTECVEAFQHASGGSAGFVTRRHKPLDYGQQVSVSYRGWPSGRCIVLADPAGVERPAIAVRRRGLTDPPGVGTVQPETAVA